MPNYFATEALLPEGWARNVRIAVNELGDFGEVRAGAEPHGCERLAGPALPGMANLHSHAFQRAMAGLAEVRGDAEDDFWTWRERMYRFVSWLTPGHAFVIAQQTYIELLKHGYTAVAEFNYVHNDAEGKPLAKPAQMLLCLLEMVQRLRARRRNLVIGKRSRAVGTTLWLEAAAGGAQALGRRMGAIAPGLRADLVVLDANHPDVMERSGDAIAIALVFSARANPVRDAMVGGKWTVREAHHPREEVAAQDYRQGSRRCSRMRS